MTSIEFLEQRIQNMIKHGADFGEDLPALLVHIEEAKEMEANQCKQLVDDAINNYEKGWADKKASSQIEISDSITDQIDGIIFELPFDDKIKLWELIDKLVLFSFPEITEDTSDGYHTFKELYEFRKVYNAALFNEWARIYTGKFEQSIIDFKPKYDVHKSWRHNDGELCFGGGWFIVVAVLPTGQISNHYEAKDWELFKIPIVEKAKYEFDGHTPADVLARLNALSK